MKRVLSLSSFLVLMVAFFIGASNYGESLEVKADSFKVMLPKGWNMVPISLTASIPKEKIKVMYIYDPQRKRFLGGRDVWGPKDTLRSTVMLLSKLNPAFSEWYGVFVYLSDPIILDEKENNFFSYLRDSVEKQVKNLEYLTLAKGWNIVSPLVFLGREGKSFDEISGTCDIQRIYVFDAAEQKFKKLSLDTTLPSSLEEMVNAFLIKVANKCKLSLEPEKLTPPQLPGEFTPTPLEFSRKVFKWGKKYAIEIPKTWSVQPSKAHGGATVMHDVYDEDGKLVMILEEGAVPRGYESAEVFIKGKEYFPGLEREVNRFIVEYKKDKAGSIIYQDGNMEKGFSILIPFGEKPYPRSARDYKDGKGDTLRYASPEAIQRDAVLKEALYSIVVY